MAQVASQEPLGQDLSGSSSRDAIGFAAGVAFAISVYSSVVSLFPALEPVRPALFTAALASAALLFGRVASRLSLTLDGARGLALIALSVWALASMSWSINSPATRAEALELAKLCAIYLTLVNLIRTPKRLAWVCGAAVLASLVPSWGAVARWLDGTDLLDGYRARWLGVYADPNHLAMSLVAIVPLAATFALFWRSWLLRLLGAVAAGLAVTAIVLTHSRGGALGLALAVVLWALSGAKRLRALAIVGALAAAVTFFAPKSFWERTETIAAYEEDVSAQGRIWAWEVASAINRDRPIAGVGAGAFRYAWPLYAPPEARGAAFVAHNIFLSELGELGLVGFMLFLVFLSRALAGAFKAARHPTVGPLARAVAAGLSGYILCDMMSGYVLSAHFFLLVALAAAAERLARQRADGLEQARRIP